MAAGLQSKSESELLLLKSKAFADTAADAEAAAFFLAAFALMLTPPRCRFVEEGAERAGLLLLLPVAVARLPTAGDCLMEGGLLLALRALPVPAWPLTPSVDFVGVAAFDGDLLRRSTNADTSFKALALAAANLALASSLLVCSSLPPLSPPPQPLPLPP